MKKMLSLLFLVILSVPVFAQVPAYGQCGGIGYIGPTSCVAGFTCTVANSYYSQCLPGGTGGSSGGDGTDIAIDNGLVAQCYTVTTYDCLDGSGGFATQCNFTGNYGNPTSCKSVTCGPLIVISSRYCVKGTK